VEVLIELVLVEENLEVDVMAEGLMLLVAILLLLAEVAEVVKARARSKLWRYTYFNFGISITSFQKFDRYRYMLLMLV